MEEGVNEGEIADTKEQEKEVDKNSTGGRREGNGGG